MKKISALILALCLFAALLCSCAKGAPNNYGWSGNDSGSGYNKDSYGEKTDGEFPKSEGSFSDDLTPEQKLIKRYSVSLETTEYDKAKSEIASLVESYGGYFSSSSEEGGRIYSGGNRSSRYGKFTIRIPAAKLDELISELGGKGNVISSNLQ